MAAQQHSSQGGSTRPAPRERPSSGSTSRWGSLLPLAIVVVGLLELTILVLIGIRSSLWWSVLIIVIGWVVGVALLVAAGQQSFVRLRSLVRAVRGRGDVQDHLSRPAFTMLSALFFFFPGILTDLIGIILLLTPVQRRSVRALGLGNGSAGARSVLYRRTGTGMIDGEIVLENRPREGTERGGHAKDEGPGPDDELPPTITQDPRDS